MLHINKLRNHPLKKPILLIIGAAILLCLPEFTWTYYPDGIKTESKGINAEYILDSIFNGTGAFLALQAFLSFKRINSPK